MLLALLRKKPVLWIAFSSSPRLAAANAAAVGYFLNKAGVTMFTRTSVHCAERIVAIRSSSGLLKPRAHRASGYSFAKSLDRKSTRLNSSHLGISYAVFCL